MCSASAAMTTASLWSVAAVSSRQRYFLQETLSVVNAASSQDDADSRCAAVQVVNRQSFFVHGSTDYKHNNVLRPVSEAAGSQVRKLTVSESTFNQLVQSVMKQRLMLSVHVLHALEAFEELFSDGDGVCRRDEVTSSDSLPSVLDHRLNHPAVSLGHSSPAQLVHQ